MKLKKAYVILIFISILITMIVMLNHPKIVKYQINEKHNFYNVEERINEKSGRYDVAIKDSKNKIYIYDKNKKIKKIKQIKEYNNNDLTCIIPFYSKNKFDNILCNLKGRLMSPSYLLNENNDDFKEIVNKIKKEEINIKMKKTSNKIKTIKKGNNSLKIYYNNIPNDVIFTVWQYKGIYTISKAKQIYNEFLENDQYNNDNKLLVDKYFIIADTKPDQYQIEKFLSYDIVKNTIQEIEVDKPLSNNYYYNGKYDDILYITDIDNKRQITVNLKNKEINEIGNLKKKFVNINDNKIERIQPSIFLESKYVFDDTSKNKIIETMYGKGTEIKKNNNKLYFKTSDNRIYVALQGLETKATLLLKLNNIKEWKITSKGELIIVTEDKMYFYDDQGLVPIVENKEFKYKNKNVCDIYNLK